MKFAFVILHYKTDQDTHECIESIEKIEIPEEDKLDIVIVDNASNNGSLEKLQNIYRNIENVYFVESDINLGFAKGNNLGFKFAKENLNSDFIIVLNNDTLIGSNDILYKIKSAYEKYRFGVMGPDIISILDKKHQNPVADNKYKVECKKLKKEIFKYRLLLVLSKLGIYSALKKFFSRKNENCEESKFMELIENCKLHGACLIFSNIFIKNENAAFCKHTFLYGEEDILFLYCKEKKYKTIYFPGICIFHKEDSSTNYVNNNSKTKREFLFKNLIKSHIIIIEFLQGKIGWE